MYHFTQDLQAAEHDRAATTTKLGRGSGPAYRVLYHDSTTASVLVVALSKMSTCSVEFVHQILWTVEIAFASLITNINDLRDVTQSSVVEVMTTDDQI